MPTGRKVLSLTCRIHFFFKNSSINVHETKLLNKNDGNVFNYLEVLEALVGLIKEEFYILDVNFE